MLAWTRAQLDDVTGTAPTWLCIVVEPPLPAMTARLQASLEAPTWAELEVRSWGVRGWSVQTHAMTVALRVLAWALDLGADQVLIAGADRPRAIEDVAAGRDPSATAVVFDWGRPLKRGCS